MSTAAGFTRSKWFSVFVIWTTSNWLDMDGLGVITLNFDTVCSHFSAQQGTLFVDGIVQVGEEISWELVLSNSSWITSNEVLELWVWSIISANFARDGCGVVSFVVENVGEETVHWFEWGLSFFFVWVVKIFVVEFFRCLPM